MKINTKLIISNIFITVISMIVLSLVITSVIKNHIQSGIEKDLIEKNELIVDKVHYTKLMRFAGLMGRKDKNAIMFCIFDKDNNTIVNCDEKLLMKSSKDILINEINKQKLGQIQDVKVADKDALVYVQNAIIESKEFLVCTFIFNNDIAQITSKIINVVILLVVIISAVIIIITTLISNKITMPFKEILRGTNAFANKEFDKKIVVKTKDEFNELAIAMNEMADNLNKQDLEQKKFYEDYSHDLKTPLTVISGYAQGLKSGVIEKNDESLALIEEECSKLKTQIENMIYLSKLDTINDAFRFESLEINKLISESLVSLDSLLIVNDINIEFKVDKDIYILGDKEKLIRAFTNLFSNCIKYTKDIIYVECIENDNNINIVIADNGEGFSNEILLNPFTRTAVGKQNGSGIGLSIVLKIITKHGGSINLSNRIGGGACYSITLPKMCHK